MLSQEERDNVSIMKCVLPSLSLCMRDESYKVDPTNFFLQLFTLFYLKQKTTLIFHLFLLLFHFHTTTFSCKSKIILLELYCKQSFGLVLWILNLQLSQYFSIIAI